MHTAAQIWLDYGRTLDVGATEKAFAEVDREMTRLRAALRDARDALRNDFEPDNQSNAYKRATRALEASHDEQSAPKPEPYSRGCQARGIPGASCQHPNCDC